MKAGSAPDVAYHVNAEKDTLRSCEVTTAVARSDYFEEHHLPSSCTADTGQTMKTCFPA